jgi:hypothetical protein
VPRTLRVQLEIAKAIHTLTSQHEGESLGSRAGNPPLGKAAADDPAHPGWPAGTPGGKGGQFRPKDRAANAPDQQAETRNDVQAIIATARRLIWLEGWTLIKSVLNYVILYWKDASRPAVTSIRLISTSV